MVDEREDVIETREFKGEKREERREEKRREQKRHNRE
jgi:hypothetical protein